MVAVRKMDACAKDDHDKCPSRLVTKRDEFGGTICSYSCHAQKALEKEKNKDLYMPPKRKGV